MKVLVCGGREYLDRDNVFQTLDHYPDITLLIHGAASGADTLAEMWAKSRQVNYVGIPAKWKKLGRKAGPLRNREMLAMFASRPPDIIIAFPGGPGTADMMKIGRETGIKVDEILAPPKGVTECQHCGVNHSNLRG